MDKRTTRLEERIRKDVQAETRNRERGEAETEEQLEGIEARVGQLEEQQKKFDHRLRWIERHLGVGTAPAKPKRG